jgi:hypothetical protein
MEKRRSGMFEFLVTTKSLGEQLVYVDDKDKKAVMQANTEDAWKIGYDNKRRTVYIFRMVQTPKGRRMQFIHNFITGKNRVKHKDGNPCNNQRRNLICSETKKDNAEKAADARQKRIEALAKQKPLDKTKKRTNSVRTGDKND